MNDLVIALEITALGMGLVFAAIILLWWMMVALTAFTTDKDTSSSRNTASSDATESVLIVDCNMKAKAAAAAVPIALAEQQASLAHLLVDPPTSVVSAWQLGMRTRQLYENRRRSFASRAK